MKKCILFAVFLCFSVPVYSVEYFVDIISGNNTSAGTATNTAWKHLPGTVGQTGSGWVSPGNGDTVWVRGDYTNNVQVLVNSDNYTANAAYDSILIKSGHLRSPAWGTGRAIYDGEDTRTYGFWVGGSSVIIKGVTVEGFEVRNIAAGGIGVGFDPNSGSCGIAVGGSPYEADYITVRNCYIHDCARSIDDTGHGIETAGASSELLYENNHIGPNIGTKGIETTINCTEFRVRNNYIEDYQDHGIAIAGKFGDVYNNLVRSHPPFVHQPNYGIKCDDGQFIDVWNNVIFRSQTTPTIEADAIRNQDAAHSNRWFHNTVWDFDSGANGGSYTPVGLGDSNDTFKDVFFENNILNLIETGGSNGVEQIYVHDTLTNLTVNFNNFFHTSASDFVVIYGLSPSVYYTSAGFNAASLGSGYVVSNNTQVAPNFVGGILPSGLDENFQPNTSYFKLTESTSSLIKNTGNSKTGNATHGYSSSSSKFDLDIVGTTRTQWSMGAYEYATNVWPVVQDSPPNRIWIGIE